MIRLVIQSMLQKGWINDDDDDDDDDDDYYYYHYYYYNIVCVKGKLFSPHTLDSSIIIT